MDHDDKANKFRCMDVLLTSGADQTATVGNTMPPVVIALVFEVSPHICISTTALKS